MQRSVFADIWEIWWMSVQSVSSIRAPRLVHLSPYSHISRFDLTTVDEPKKVHYSVDLSGKTVVEMRFVL